MRLVTERGLEGLSLRALGARPELGLSGTAPLHYFGSMRGLLGAIAARGFEELSGRLRCVREAIQGHAHIGDLAVEYAHFALTNPHLYRAMHAGQFWRSSASGEATERTQTWIQRARGARDGAFEEFLLAARESLHTKTIEGIGVERTAHAVTALTDGFLFQILEENIGEGQPIDEQLNELKSLLVTILGGPISAPSPGHPPGRGTHHERKTESFVRRST